MSEEKVLDSGDEFFEELWASIDNSKKCCWILTYHINKSLVGDETLKRLIKAAERGVDIILYVDWLNCTMDSELEAELLSKGGKIEKLNPMISWIKLPVSSVFERYHQKIILIDDQVFIGSTNFDIEYAGNKYGNNSFYDLNVKLTKKCLNEAKDVFFEIALKFGFKIVNHSFNEVPDDNFEIITSEPYYYMNDIQERLLHMIHNAKQRVILVSGYYFNNKKLNRGIKDAVNRGVKVELITSKVREQEAYKHLDNYKLTKALRQTGAKVSEFIDDRVLHMKVSVIDDQVVLGSFNWDKWSWSLNNELNVSIRNDKVLNDVMKTIEYIKSKSQPVIKKRLDLWSKTKIHFWTKFLNFSEWVMNRRRPAKLEFMHAFLDDPTCGIEERYLKKVEKAKERQTSTFIFQYFNTV